MAVRTEADIISDLQEIECGLSPENLSCDGEASAAQIRSQSARLNRQRRALIVELGREPTQQELFPELFGGTIDRRPVNHSSQGSIMNNLLDRVTTDHQVGDVVRLSNRSEIIITKLNENRPANKYSGVLVRGQGKEYIFGDKHRPVFVRKADPNHPALLALKVKLAAKGVVREPIAPPVTFDLKAAVVKLLEMVDQVTDVDQASIYVNGSSNISGDTLHNKLVVCAKRVKDLL